jgi:hypothetical protein
VSCRGRHNSGSALARGFDIRRGLWHTSKQIIKALMETSRRAGFVQRVQGSCELDTKAPLKILPEPPTERVAEKYPE